MKDAFKKAAFSLLRSTCLPYHKRNILLSFGTVSKLCFLRLLAHFFPLYTVYSRGQKTDSASTQQEPAAAAGRETKRTNKYLRASSSCSALNICNYSVQRSSRRRRSQGGWSSRPAPSCARKKTPAAAFSDVEREEKAPWFIPLLRPLAFARSPFNRESVQVSQSKASLK